MSTKTRIILPPCVILEEPQHADDLLKRFLFLGNNHGFITGDAERHGWYTMERALYILDLVLCDTQRFVDIVRYAESSTNLPNRDPIFFALALAVSTDELKEPVKRALLYRTALQLCKDDRDFFSYIKFVSKQNKTFSSGINKLIGRYYVSQLPNELVKYVGGRLGYHGWTHKDLIKLSHVKTDNILIDVILTFVLKGVEKATAVAKVNKEALDLVDYLSKCKAFRSCSEEEKMLEYCKELHIEHDQIPPHFNKSAKIWTHLLDEVALNDLINLLPRLYKIGLLKNDTTIQNKVIEMLANADAVKASRLNPVEVLIALRNFEKGGKPKDPRLVKHLEEKAGCEVKLRADPEYVKPNYAHNEPVKCRNVINALNKTMMHSYHNLEPTGKRFLITIDVSDAMDKPCITSKNVKCIEAAVIITLCLLKAEKHVSVAVFNAATITLVTLEKGGSVKQCVKKLLETPHDTETYGAPIEWAKNENKQFDVFINMHNNMNLLFGAKPFNNPFKALSKYKSVMNLPSAKLILCNFGSVRIVDFPKIALDIRGFDKNVPKIIDAFIKNQF